MNVQESKTCLGCGTTLCRGNRSTQGWKRLRFCSISCGSRAAWAERRKDLRERVAEKVDKRGGGCWLWTGSKTKEGYGLVNVDGKANAAHRVVYELEVAVIPAGLHLDHLCRTPACVNPAHLEPVTPKENARRGLQGELKKTCANGHPWTPENWSRNGSGRKMCAICHRERVRQYKRKKRDERRAAA